MANTDEAGDIFYEGKSMGFFTVSGITIRSSSFKGAVLGFSANIFLNITTFIRQKPKLSN